MKSIIFMVITALLLCAPAMARGEADIEERLENLQRELEKVKEELKYMKEKQDGETDVAEQVEELQDEVALLSEGGLLKKASIGGYGELHYNNFDSSSGKSDEIDFHRFVLFFGYDFNDWIKFESELEVEHALSGEGKDGEVELEQAFIDFQTSQFLKVPVNIRAGLMLVPVGIINQYHEPSVFYGVERPDVEKNIIPTTWWEAGAGIYGDIGSRFNYKLYLVSSLDASGFKSGSGIRSGRQKVSEAFAEDFALTGRLDFTGLPGLRVGTSFFRGNTGQGEPALGDATVSLYSADIQYSIGMFDFRGLYALIDIHDADKISAQNGTVIGERLYGGYVEGAFRFLNLIFPDTEQEMAVFARYEKYNTQDKVAAGLTADPANDVEVLQVGLDYKPHPSVVIKLDYQDRDNNSSSKEATDQFNIGVGYMF
jgi:opacity protein-like surface antigen